MTYIVLKDFPYSSDGVTVKVAVAGDRVELPEFVVPGLLAEKLIAMDAEGTMIQKDMGAAPENKMMPATEENKRAVAKGPGGRWFVHIDGVRQPKAYATQHEAEAAI